LRLDYWNLAFRICNLPGIVVFDVIISNRGRAANAQTDQPEIPPAQSSVGRGRAGRLAILAAVLILMAGLVVILFWPPPADPFVWLPANPGAASKKSTPWSRARLQLILITYPVLRHFHRQAPAVTIDATAVTVDPQDWAIISTNCGVAVSTNSAGDVAWTASADMAVAIRQQIEMLHFGDSNTAHGPMRARMTTSSGRSARMTTTRGQSSNDPGVIITFTLDLTPKVVSHAIRLEFGGELARSAVPTNLTNSLNCRALLKNGGALIVRTGHRQAAAANPICLFIIRATATDPQGNPLKL